jgi:hypothetical protein
VAIVSTLDVQPEGQSERAEVMREGRWESVGASTSSTVCREGNWMSLKEASALGSL